MKNNQSGQIFILALIVLALVMVSTVLIISGALNFFQNSKYTVESSQALNLAEAGIDQAVATLNATAGSYNPDPNQEIALGNGTYTLSITSISSLNKKIEAIGYVPNKSNPRAKKLLKLQTSKGIGASFNYGVQVGDGGMDMSNNVAVIGSVYSNGSINLGNNAYITGDAYVAGGVQPTADQQADCSGSNCADLIFGKTSGSETDIAQSFTPSTTATLTKVAVKLAKVGTPSDLTLRLLANDSTRNQPNKSQVLASGTLTASLVTSNYGFVEIVFANPYTLTNGTTYWIMLDASSNSSNYWKWQYDTTNGYTRGQAKWISNWQAQTQIWNTINGDLGFKIYLGGVATAINGSNNAVIYGNARANTLSNLDIRQDAYYQLQQNITVNRTNCTNNPKCHPNSADPVPQPMPLSDNNIAEWQQLAQNTAVFTGDVNTCRSTLPAGKYIGSINIPNGCRVTVGSPIWVTGNFNLAGNDRVTLDAALGGSSGVIMVDNFITMGNGNLIVGNGQSGSYLILLSTFNSRDDPTLRVAIDISNSGNTGIVYSNLGSVQVTNLNYLVSITAWKLVLGNNAIVNYDQGLANAFFSSGPSGSFTVIKGTYQDK